MNSTPILLPPLNQTTGGGSTPPENNPILLQPVNATGMQTGNGFSAFYANHKTVFWIILIIIIIIIVLLFLGMLFGRRRH
jgi:hypothetical protein